MNEMSHIVSGIQIFGSKMVALFGEVWEVWQCWRMALGAGFERLLGFLLAVQDMTLWNYTCK